MPVIRPSADLRNNYNEISKLCHETKQPVFITKNGYNDLVILSNEAFEQYENERIEKLVEEKFSKHYSDFESFKKEIFEKIELARNDIKTGKVRPFEDFCAELEETYNYND